MAERRSGYSTSCHVGTPKRQKPETALVQGKGKLTLVVVVVVNVIVPDMIDFVVIAWTSLNLCVRQNAKSDRYYCFFLPIERERPNFQKREKGRPGLPARFKVFQRQLQARQ